MLVIEEINRGNPAQIFGEMLTLLEDTKRSPSEAIELAYRKGDERVYVPKNLYVIGTMNVADRSLAIVDLALRRRFAFVDLEPRFGRAWRTWCSKRGLDERILAGDRNADQRPQLGDRLDRFPGTTIPDWTFVRDPGHRRQSDEQRGLVPRKG